MKKTCRAIQTEEVIDLTTDEFPDEFTMLVDVPLDDEDIDKQVENTGGDSENEFDNNNDEGGFWMTMMMKGQFWITTTNLCLNISLSDTPFTLLSILIPTQFYYHFMIHDS